MPHPESLLVAEIVVLALPTVIDNCHVEDAFEGFEPFLPIGFGRGVKQKISLPGDERESILVRRLRFARFLRGDQDLHNVFGLDRGT